MTKRCRCGVRTTWKEHGICEPCDKRNRLVTLLLAAFMREHHFGHEADFLTRIVDGGGILAERRQAA